MNNVLVLNKIDNVGVITSNHGTIPSGHKVALMDISCGESIIKYGMSIGKAIKDIQKGEHIHSHNMETNLKGVEEYVYKPYTGKVNKFETKTFRGYERSNGKVGIRNEIWVINTVGCINKTAEKIVKLANKKNYENVDGIYTFSHPYGCSQLGDDHENTQKILADLVMHPNAAGVLVLGLGCENNNIREFKKVLGNYDNNRVKFLETQCESDEILKGLEIVDKLAPRASKYTRTDIDASKLVIGLKCGGSDAYSGITANPLAGSFSDMLLKMGGTTILTEVPEMFGAEETLMKRCISEDVFNKCVNMINSFKDYYISAGENIYENPSPGNKEGGITTLEEKSIGCTMKAGSGIITDVLEYSDRISNQKGIVLLEGPGNDMVASTALAAAGAHLVIFTTGRGTPFGTCVPTVKVSSNTELYNKKSNWMDFDAGPVLTNGLESIKNDFMEYILDIASGSIYTKNEIEDYREISIFKTGVTL